MKKSLIVIPVSIIVLFIGAYSYLNLSVSETLQTDSIDTTDTNSAENQITPKITDIVSTNKIVPTENNIKEKVQYVENGNNLSLMIDGKNVQTLNIDDKTLVDFAYEFKNLNIKKFITNLDVTFDGYADIGVVSGIGYMGVNVFYDFYVYNPETQRLYALSDLKGISNPSLDTNLNNRTVLSAYKDGPSWYEDKYIYELGKFTHVTDPKMVSLEKKYAMERDIAGTWSFKEVSQSYNNTASAWTWILSTHDGDSSKGLLSVDGFQTLLRYNVDIVKFNDSYNVIFNSYAKENESNSTYKAGDILLNIKPTKDSAMLQLTFVKIHPYVNGVKDYYMIRGR